MADEKQQDGQKTIVAFVVGLLIGGMLVWAFSGPSTNAPTTTDDEASEEAADTTDESTTEENTSEDTASDTPVLQVGTGAIVVNDQPASATIALSSATYPVGEGWIGVREFDNEQLGFILGVVRFSESQGLVPQEIVLQRPTSAGKQYAVVVYTENGDFDFNLASDVQIDTVFDTFKAE
jgi:hypothetical protein